MFFTVEETNLMCCFDTSSRSKLIAEMKNLPLNDLDNEMDRFLDDEYLNYHYEDEIMDHHTL